MNIQLDPVCPGRHCDRIERKHKASGETMPGDDAVRKPLQAEDPPGERYCRQHATSTAPSKPLARCRSMTPEGMQCAEKSAEGKQYCQKHLKKE